MSDKKLSGAQKRKVQREKEKRDKQLLTKIPKLTGYFKPGGCQGQDVAADDADRDHRASSLSSLANKECPTVSECETEGSRTEPADTAGCGSGVQGVSNDVLVSANVSPLAAESAQDGSNPANVTWSSDPACWETINEDMRKYWIKMGPETCQNKDADVAASERQHKHQKRYFSKTLFTRKLANGESVEREWLLYSPSKGSVFCFACKLFGDSDFQSAFTTGYSDWKNATARLAEHEGSKSHKKAMVACVTRCADVGCIDTELKKQFDSECEYWTEVLKRVVAVVKFLAERGLPFRGRSEIFGQADNGNFM